MYVCMCISGFCTGQTTVPIVLKFLPFCPRGVGKTFFFILSHFWPFGGHFVTENGDFATISLKNG